jgi:hypothetical protein
MLAGTGQRERCLRCGEMVVAVFRKLCSRCGRDVTRSPRLKNASGEYYCQPCWLEVCEAQGKEPAYQCGECGGLFPDDQVYQEKTQYVCKECFAARTSDAGNAVAALSGLAEAEQSPETAPAGFTPSYYTSTVAARNAEQARRARVLLMVTMVGATILIVGVTVLLVWYRS